MINSQLRDYEYKVYDTTEDEYGQETLGEVASGTIKIAINYQSNSNSNDVRYQDVTYTGLTHDDIDDKCVVLYKDKKLKVKFVNPFGRMKQVFFVEVQ